MSLHELFVFTFMSLIALGNTTPSASTSPTSNRIDGTPSATFIPSHTATLRSATVAAATTGANGTVLAPQPQSSSTIALAAVVPIGAVSATVAAIIFRKYRTRWERERKEAEKTAPAELEAGTIPIELEAREQGYGRYSPGR